MFLLSLVLCLPNLFLDDTTLILCCGHVYLVCAARLRSLITVTVETIAFYNEHVFGQVSD